VSLTLFKRIDIDLNWYFSAVSVGFTLHRRGFQLSLLFFDIDIYYCSPKLRAEIEERAKTFKAIAYAMEEEQWYEG
jgi:hypothetical protein